MSQEYEEDHEIVLHSPEDLDEAMYLIQFHLEHALTRGDHIKIKVLSPPIKGGSVCSASRSKTGDIWKGYSQEM